jgi:UDP-N-acetylmuramoylalanine--D-glutamate ligase
VGGELECFLPSPLAADMAEAVRLAHASARPGDVVLLAPACASYDMFESYEHRGRAFKEEVRKLTQQSATSSRPERQEAAAVNAES